MIHVCLRTVIALNKQRNDTLGLMMWSKMKKEDHVAEKVYNSFHGLHACGLLSALIKIAR